MKYRYISDSHVHSKDSFDGCESIEVLCDAAVRMGLDSITITDHCECNEINTSKELDCIRSSVLNAKKAANLYAGKLKVFHGVELGQTSQNPGVAKELLGELDFDFILGSLHNIRGYQDFFFMNFNEMDVDYLLKSYFEEMLEIIELDFYDSLAHLTYPFRYITGEYGINIDYEKYSERIDLILKNLAEKGKALEVNSSGLRQKLKTTMPSAITVRRFHELGGRYVTIGSDAHRWPDVGSGLEKALDEISRAGFSEYAIYSERSPQPVSIIK